MGGEVRYAGLQVHKLSGKQAFACACTNMRKYKKIYELCWQASKQTVATVHRYNDNMKNKKIIIIKVWKTQRRVHTLSTYTTTVNTHAHTLRLHRAWGKLLIQIRRAIYDHLMHNEPPISGCVGREMRCGVFPIQLHANTLTITSSTTSGHLHTAAHNLPERHKETDFMGRWNRHFVPKAPVCGCADENKRENE